MSRYYYFIINQQSQRFKESIELLGRLLPKYTHHFQLYLTDSVDQAHELLLQLKKSLWPEDIIVAVGGDGSLHTLVNLVKHLKIENPLSFLPAGSGNDFARANNISLDFSTAVHDLFTDADLHAMDLLHLSSQSQNFFAVNSIGYGLDGEIIHAVHQNKKKKKSQGEGVYLKAALKGFTQLKPFAIDIKTGEESLSIPDAQLVLFVNNPYLGGGIEVYPTAENDDQLINILIARQVNAFNFLKIFGRVLTGRNFLNHPQLKTLTVKKAQFTVYDRQYAQKDGEPFLLYNESAVIDLDSQLFYF